MNLGTRLRILAARRRLNKGKITREQYHELLRDLNVDASEAIGVTWGRPSRGRRDDHARRAGESLERHEQSGERSRTTNPPAGDSGAPRRER